MIKFENKNIINIIRSLYVDSAYGYAKTFIRMLMARDFVIAESLSIIFSDCINQRKFLDLRKKQ